MVGIGRYMYIGTNICINLNLIHNQMECNGSHGLGIDSFLEKRLKVLLI